MMRIYKKILTSLTLLISLYSLSHAATQIYIPSTSTFHDYTINIGSGTIRNFTVSTFTATNWELNVKSFGATGNGVTDDSTAVQNAINSLTSGGTVFFPKGTYKMSVSIQGAGTDRIWIRGEGLGTIFIPISTSAFVFNSVEGFSGYNHLYSDFQIKSATGAYGIGRGFYFNNAAFNDIQNVRLQDLEYGIYSNSTEWGHIFNVNIRSKYGIILTTLNSDILGNAPQVSQNPAYWSIIQTHIWGNSGDGPGIGLYIDNKDDTLGDKNSAVYITDSDLIQNPSQIAIGGGGNSGSKYNAMHIQNVFLNNTNSTTTQTFNGFTIYNGDLSISSGNVKLTNVHLEDNIHILGNSRVTGSDVQILAGFSNMTVTIDTSSIVNIDNLVGDQNGGFVFDQIEGRNFQSVTAGRPLTMRLPSARTAFTSTLYKNVISADTTTGAFGNLPVSFAGSPTIAFQQGDGLYANTAVKINGVASDAVKWRANLTNNKYYVTTFSVKATTTTTVDVVNSLGFFTGNGTLHLSTDWRTFGAIGQSAFTGTAIFAFSLTQTTTFYVSCFQTCEFDTQDAAAAFLDSNTFALIPSEVRNRQFQSSAIPSTGTWNTGDLIWNTNPTTSTPVGWINISSGIPGSWNGFGTVLDSAGNLSVSLSTITTLNTTTLKNAGVTTISNLSTGVGILGTNTNDNPTPGNYGQVASSNTSITTNYPASGNFGDLCSTTVASGDWMFSGIIRGTLNGATDTDTFIGISQTAGNSGTGLVNGQNSFDCLPASTGDSTCSIPMYHVQLAAPTTIYLKYSATYTGGPPKATGSLIGLRIR